jgi:hypothetical protein
VAQLIDGAALIKKLELFLEARITVEIRPNEMILP